MHHSRLFNQPRLQLALLYSGVIGGILLILGSMSHFVIQKAFDRMVDRELHLLSMALNTKLEVILQEPGRLPARADQIIPALCVHDRICQVSNSNSTLAELVQQQNYHLQLLNLQGEPLAAIAEPVDLFPANPQLLESQTVKTKTGEPYHLHLMPLQTRQGQQWGYLQVGRSVQKIDDYLQSLHLLILVGVPTSMLLIGGASWKLAGLAMRPIYQSYERMQQFTADVAHELKTPIAASQAILEVALGDHQLTIKNSRKALRAQHRQTQRLNHLVQDLLLLARLDDQSFKVAEMDQVICLQDLLQDLEEELAPLAMAAQVELVCEIQVNHPVNTVGNTNQLYRLVSNLVINAINYTPPQGIVVIRLNQIMNNATIQVEDTGMGIAAKDLPHIFDRFYRINQDRSRQTGGSGLGLAIVQAIVQAHGGTIQTTSQLGQGSTFTVQIPLKPRKR